MVANYNDIVLAGHPYAPIGMGEHLRCSFRAFRSIAVNAGVLDIYGLNEPEEAALSEIKYAETQELRSINVFHINGDEVEQALAHLSQKWRADAYNVVYPAWELSHYPAAWARQLERFDEVWAPSQFIQQSVRQTVRRPVVHMPLACEVLLSSFLGRRYFGIPENAYTFLFFFDFRSYMSRKNPDAVIECFRRVLAARPYAPVSLVIKINGSEHAPAAAKQLADALRDIRDRVVLLDKTMTDNEVKNLVRCCDCFVSLHRSEGFGRGIAESMYLAKPVIATAYSGNMDFMTSENSLPVDYRIIDVPLGAYPFPEGQVWADPDVGEATRHMVHLVDRPEAGFEIGRIASLNIRSGFSFRKTGLRYGERLRAIMRERQTRILSEETRRDSSPIDTRKRNANEEPDAQVSPGSVML